MLDDPIVIYALVFAAALLIVDTLFRVLFSARRSKSEVRNRLADLKQKRGTDEAYGELLKRRGLGGWSGQQTIGGSFNQYFAQTGLEIRTPRRIVYVVSLFILGFVFAGVFLKVNLVLQYVIATAFALGASFFAIYYFRAKRIKVFTQQLPDAIDIIVRSLNAGHPLVSAIALVAREMPDPIGSEFGILSDQMTFGSELEQAMLNMGERVGAPELNLLTVTVSVQRGTGGNLSEILENLGQMVRDRLMIKAKIRAISAEGRITSWIMLLFPFFLFFMIRFLVPTYFDLVWESGYGPHIVVACLFLIFMGMIVIRRLVNFDF